MPLPRKPAPKRSAGDTRSRRRHVRTCLWLDDRLSEEFAYIAGLIEQKRRDAAKEKAPGLATGGSSSSED